MEWIAIWLILWWFCTRWVRRQLANRPSRTIPSSAQLSAEWLSMTDEQREEWRRCS